MRITRSFRMGCWLPLVVVVICIVSLWTWDVYRARQEHATVMHTIQPTLASLPRISDLTVLQTRAYMDVYIEGDHSCHYLANLMLGSHLPADELMTLYINGLHQKGWIADSRRGHRGMDNLSSVSLRREPREELDAFTREPDEYFGERMGYAEAKASYPTILFVLINYRLEDRTACD